MDNRSATSSTCCENPNGGPQSYASAMAKLDKVTAERDRLAQKLDDEPDSKKYARDLVSLISASYEAANSDDQRALISNLGSLLQQAGSTIDALMREIGHYANSEAWACEERDELRALLVEFAPDPKLAAEWSGGAMRFSEAFRAAQAEAQAQAEAIEPDEVVDGEVVDRDWHAVDLSEDWLTKAFPGGITNRLGVVIGRFESVAMAERAVEVLDVMNAPLAGLEDLADHVSAIRTSCMQRGMSRAETDLEIAGDLLADYRITKKK